MFRRAEWQHAGRIAQHVIAEVRALSDPKATIPLGAVLNNDWFELWYQPKIELKSLHLIGAEALVRARHPTRGIVSPALFLPGASEDEMHALTERVILTALGDWEDFAQSACRSNSPSTCRCRLWSSCQCPGYCARLARVQRTGRD